MEEILNPMLYEQIEHAEKFDALMGSVCNKYDKDANQLLRGYKRFCNELERKRIKLSDYQLAIILWVIFGGGNAMVSANAGSGKSFTIKICCLALHYVFSLKECDIYVVQFNSTIAEENRGKLKNMANSKTMHSIGYGVFTKCYIPSRILFNRADGKTPQEVKDMYINVMEDRWKKNIEYNDYAYLRSHSNEFARNLALSRYQRKENEILTYEQTQAIANAKDYVDGFISNVTKVFDLCRTALINGNNLDAIDGVARHFRISWVGEELLVLSALLQPNMSYNAPKFKTDTKRNISYTDMLVYGLSCSVNAERAHTKDYMPQPVFVFGDEGQDFNTLNKVIITRMSRKGRCMVVGDRRQSINGFCGADIDAFDNTKEALHAQEFPLSVCYRCDKNIIELAQQEVSSIEAREDAEDGIVRYSHIFEEIQAKDLLLFRKTANQIKVAMFLNKNGILCRVKGGDGFQTMLEKAVKETKSIFMEDAIRKMDGRLKRRAKKVADKENISIEQAMQTDAIAQYADIVDCVKVLAKDCKTTQDAIIKIADLFSDQIPQNAVVACTIHKAKGLEADRVWLMENPISINDFMLEWEIQQEHNLWYVAVTRAKHELIWFDADIQTLDLSQYRWGTSKLDANQN